MNDDIRSLPAGIAAFFATQMAAEGGPTLDAIKARGELRVRTTSDCKPFNFEEADGTPWERRCHTCAESVFNCCVITRVQGLR